MNQDLKSRIPVAIAYVLSIAIFTLSGPIPTSLLLLIFLILCITEYVHPSLQRHSSSKIYIYGILLLVLFLSITLVPLQLYNFELVVISCLIFLFNGIILLFKKRTLLTLPSILLTSFFYLLLPFIIGIRLSLSVEHFPLLLLGTFIILWLNDAGAYFLGKAFGRYKLFPTVSPSKTWEGLIGGGIVGLLICFPLYKLIGILSLKSWIIISVIIWISGSIGDLSESSWKRHLKIKDSGTFLKGHGGFLDRLDSFIYSLPFVSLYFLLIIRNL